MGYPNNNHYLPPTPGGSYYSSAELAAYRERGSYPPLPGTSLDWRDYNDYRRDYDRQPDRRPPPSSSTNNS